MINLLPLSYKKRLNKQYRIRIGIILGSFLLAGLIIYIIMLIPGWLSLHDQETLLEENRARIASTSDYQEGQELQQTVEDLLDEFKVFSSNYSNDVVISSEVIFPVLKQKPETITISEIFYTDTSVTTNDLALVRIEGTADNRETLVRFVRDLRTLPRFNRVESPISNYIQNEALPFFTTSYLE